MDRPCYGDSALLIVLFRGEGHYHHGPEETKAGRGSLIYYAHGQWQKYHATGRYEGIGFHFLPGTRLLDTLAHYGITGGHVSPSGLNEHQINELSEVFAYQHLPPSVAFHRMDILVERLMLLMVRDAPDKCKKPREMRLADIHSYILQHPESDLSIDRLAQSVNLSPSRFAAVFRQEFGMPVGTLIRQTRLDHARDMIQNTTLTAAEIGTRLGYSTPFSFYAAYKEHHGVPPMSHRSSSSL
ncbi:MAG: AraC family transcriptional regulator [Verrucomicrobiae bacterium]|nr:AraC family transcriptional regulator [Verrucomicrobiae bacterium]